MPGLSPRVRGNPGLRVGGIEIEGSIPACAGEPNSAGSRRGSRRVYPRVCGGTVLAQSELGAQQGLSPRVRGNLRPTHVPIPNLGSIPACAGEPTTRWARRGCSRVYPRVCGGTSYSRPSTRTMPGLSPRVRGNPGRGARRDRRLRSIPACAGEPRTKLTAAARLWVYPRVCGGTLAHPRLSLAEQGLSPRVRGNHSIGFRHDIPFGSIPACAGEPMETLHGEHDEQVYPRVCGGTRHSPRPHGAFLGLSPRVRGNRWTVTCAPVRGGSIPACAGEPQGLAKANGETMVYPRVCGGTVAALPDGDLLRGLSPRVRGNRRRRHHHFAPLGSIPACAGEPWPWSGALATCRVYPRVCGGTI